MACKSTKAAILDLRKTILTLGKLNAEAASKKLQDAVRNEAVQVGMESLDDFKAAFVKTFMKMPIVAKYMGNNLDECLTFLEAEMTSLTTRVEKHDRIENLEADLRKDKIDSEFLYNRFGTATDARGYFIRLMKKKFVDAFLVDRTHGQLVSNNTVLNQNVRELKLKLIDTVANYLTNVLQQDVNKVVNTTLFNDLGLDIRPFLNIASEKFKNILETDMSEYLSQAYRTMKESRSKQEQKDEARQFLDAYNAYITLLKFDTVLKDVVGLTKTVEMDITKFNQLDTYEPYSLSMAAENMWGNQFGDEVEDIAELVSNLPLLLVETMDRYEFDSLTPMEDVPLTYSDFGNLIAYLKDLTNNPTIKNVSLLNIYDDLNFVSQWSINQILRLKTDRGILKRVVNAEGKVEFILDNDVTLYDLIAMMTDNPQIYSAALFDYLCNPALKYNRGIRLEAISSTINTTMKNVMWSLYMQLYKNESIGSVKSIFQLSNNGGVNPIYETLTLNGAALYKEHHTQIFQDENGVIGVRNLLDQTMLALNTNLQGTIEAYAMDAYNETADPSIEESWQSTRYKYLKSEYNIEITYGGSIDKNINKIDGITMTVTDELRRPILTITKTPLKIDAEIEELISDVWSHPSFRKFIKDTIGKDFDANVNLAATYEQLCGALGPVANLSNIIAEVMFNQTVNNEILYKSLHNLPPLKQTDAQVRRKILQKQFPGKPDIQRDGVYLALIPKSSRYKLNALSEAEALVNNLTSSSQVKTGEGTAVSNLGLQTLEGMKHTQIALLGKLWNSAVANLSYVHNTNGLFTGRVKVREMTTSNDTKKAIRMNAIEQFHSSFLYEFVSGFLEKQGQNIYGDGISAFLSAVYSDKPDMGRLQVNLNALGSVHNVRYKDMTDLQIEDEIRFELGTSYTRTILNLATDVRTLVSLIDPSVSVRNYLKDNVSGSLAIADLKSCLKHFSEQAPIAAALAGLNFKGKKAIKWYLHEILTGYNVNHTRHPLELGEQIHYLFDDKTGELIMNPVLEALWVRFNGTPEEQAAFVKGHFNPGEEFAVDLSGFFKLKDYLFVEDLFNNGFLLYLHNPTKAKNLGAYSSPEIKFLSSGEFTSWVSESGKMVLAKTLTGENITSVELLRQYGMNEVIIHPMLSKMSRLDYLTTLEYLMACVGSHYAHKGGKLKEDVLTLEAKRYLASDKRNNAFTATTHPYQRGSLEGVSKITNLAIIDDVVCPVYNTLGDIRVDNGHPAHDGGCFTSMEMPYFTNSSLASEAVGLDQKLFATFFKSCWDTAGQIKTAAFPATVDRMLNSPAWRRLQENMSKRSWIKEYANETGEDILENFDITMGGTLNFGESTSNGKIFYRRIINGREQMFRLDRVVHIDGSFNQYLIYEIPVNDRGLDAGISTLRIGTDGNPNITINTNWALFTEVFGGFHSLEVAKRNGEDCLVPSENSIKGLVWASNRIGYTRTPENSYKGMTQSGDIVESVYTNSELAPIMTLDDFYLPLKYSMIHYAPNKGAIKSGFTNINPTDVFTDLVRMNHCVVELYNLGVQLDKTHDSEDSHISLPTLIISACTNNGFTINVASSLYNALSTLTEIAIKPYMDELYKLFGTESNSENSDFSVRIADTIIKQLISGANDEVAIKEALKEVFGKVSEGQELTKTDIEGKVAWSSSNLYGRAFSIISSAISRDAVRMKFPGSLAVICPSYNTIVFYGDYRYGDLFEYKNGALSPEEKLKQEQEAIKNNRQLKINGEPKETRLIFNVERDVNLITNQLKLNRLSKIQFQHNYIVEFGDDFIDMTVNTPIEYEELKYMIQHGRRVSEKSLKEAGNYKGIPVVFDTDMSFKDGIRFENGTLLVNIEVLKQKYRLFQEENARYLANPLTAGLGINFLNGETFESFEDFLKYRLEFAKELQRAPYESVLAVDPSIDLGTYNRGTRDIALSNLGYSIEGVEPRVPEDGVTSIYENILRPRELAAMNSTYTATICSPALIRKRRTGPLGQTPGELYRNPFTVSKSGQSSYQATELPTMEDCVRAYDEWLSGTKYKDLEQERRLQILDTIESGTLDNVALAQEPDYTDENGIVHKFSVSEYPSYVDILKKYIDDSMAKRNPTVLSQFNIYDLDSVRNLYQATILEFENARAFWNTHPEIRALSKQLVKVITDKFAENPSLQPKGYNPKVINENNIAQLIFTNETAFKAMKEAARYIYLKQEQKDLFALTDDYKGERLITIRGKQHKVKATSIRIQPYELVMPKITIKQFGFDKWVDVAEILKDPNYFNKTAVRRLQNTLIKDYFVKDILIKGEDCFDYELKNFNGEHIYIIDLLNPNGVPSGAVELEDFPKVGIGKKVARTDRDGNILYYMSSDKDKIYLINGQEVIATENPEYYILNMQYNILRPTTSERASEERVMQVLNRVSNPDLAYYSKGLYNFLKYCKNEDGSLFDYATLMKRSQKFASLSEKLVSRYAITDDGRIRIPGGHLEPEVLSLIKNIIYDGLEMFTSFKESLDVVAGRIPAQSQQSFMTLRIIAFENPNINSAYVSSFQLWLQGSDLDIDTVTLVTSSFTNDGKYVLWSPYGSLLRRDMIEASKKLPFPTGERIDVTISERKTNSYLALDKYIGEGRLFEPIIDKSSTPENKVYKTSKDGQIQFRINARSPKLLKDLREIIEYANKEKHFYVRGSVDNQGRWMPNEAFNNDWARPTNLKQITGDPKQVFGILILIATYINKHNMYIKNAPQDIQDLMAKNKVKQAMFDTANSPINLIEGGVSIDTSTGPVQELARKSGSGADARCAPGNPYIKFDLVYQGLLGKACVGIGAVSIKVNSAIQYHYDIVLSLDNEDEQRLLLLPQTEINGKFYKGPAGIYNKIVEVDPYFYEDMKNSAVALMMLNVLELRDKGLTIKPSVAEKLAAMLSLAVDNAKELSLAKLNASDKMMGVYSYGISIGMELPELESILNSKQGRIITELTRDNIILGEKGAFDAASALRKLEGQIGQDLQQFNYEAMTDPIYDKETDALIQDSVPIIVRFGDSKVKTLAELLEKALKEKYDQFIPKEIKTKKIEVAKSNLLVSIKPKITIPQNRISGLYQYGWTLIARPEIIAQLGENTTSIDMVEAGLRTRTTRSITEVQKYNLQVGDIIEQYGKSSDGTTKRVLTRVTAIYGKDDPRYLGNWSKEGWTDEGIDDIKRLKAGAQAIEFEILNTLNILNTSREKIIAGNTLASMKLKRSKKLEDMVYHLALVGKLSDAIAEIKNSNTLSQTKAAILKESEGVEWMYALYQLMEWCEEYLKKINTFYLDSFTTDGPFIGQYKVIGKNTARDIKKLIGGAGELFVLGQILAINQGLRSKIDDFLSFRENFETCIIKRKQALGQRIDYAKDRVDMTAFVLNKDYRKLKISQYNSVKHTFNILATVANYPHMFKYIESSIIPDMGLKTISSIYRTQSVISRTVVTRNEKPISLAEFLEMQHNKIALSKARKGVENFARFTQMKHWLGNNEASFILPPGSRLYDHDFNSHITSESIRVALNTDEGLVTFRDYMETSLIPKLINRGVTSNKFIQGLTPMTIDNTVSKRKAKVYTLLGDLTRGKNETLLNLLKSYALGFRDLRNLTWDGRTNKNEFIQTWEDAFYLYANYVFNGKVGSKSLISILEETYPVMKKSHDEFVANEDTYATYVMTPEEVYAWCAPMGSVYTKTFGAVWAYDLHSLHPQLFTAKKKMTLEEVEMAIEDPELIGYDSNSKNTFYTKYNKVLPKDQLYPPTSTSDGTLNLTSRKYGYDIQITYVPGTHKILDVTSLKTLDSKAEAEKEFIDAVQYSRALFLDPILDFTDRMDVETTLVPVRYKINNKNVDIFIETQTDGAGTYYFLLYGKEENGKYRLLVLTGATSSTNLTENYKELLELFQNSFNDIPTTVLDAVGFHSLLTASEQTEKYEQIALALKTKFSTMPLKQVFSPNGEATMGPDATLIEDFIYNELCK